MRKIEIEEIASTMLTKNESLGNTNLQKNSNYKLAPTLIGPVKMQFILRKKLKDWFYFGKLNYKQIEKKVFFMLNYCLA